MEKAPPPAKDLQVAFDLGDEGSNPPPDQASPAKKAEANPEKPAGKLVKRGEGGRKPAGEQKTGEPPVSKPVTAAHSAAGKKVSPQIPKSKTEPAKTTADEDAPIISIVEEAAPPESPPEKGATPRPEGLLPPKEPEPAVGYGAEPAGNPPVEVSASEETAGEETAGEETAGEETAGEETASEETASEETASEETAGEETERIVQLINNHEGCWKVLPGGERVALSDQEWRSEMARHFKRETPAGG